MMTKTLIRVGHSAYNGTNAYRLCFSKAQAVRVLCNRGVKRSTARTAVTKAMTDSGATVYGEFGEVVEIVNEDFGLRNGHFMDSYDAMRRLWASTSEL